MTNETNRIPELEEVLDVTTEFTQFVREIKDVVHVVMRDKGYDTATTAYTAYQPYTSGHALLFEVHREPESKTKFTVQERPPVFDKEKQNVVDMPVKEGFLNVFHPDIKKRDKRSAMKKIDKVIKDGSKLAKKRQKQSLS